MSAQDLQGVITDGYASNTMLRDDRLCHENRERALVAAMILDPRAAWLLGAELSPDSFSLPEHAQIVRALLEIQAAGLSTQHTSVAVHLSFSGHEAAAKAISEILVWTPELEAAVQTVNNALAAIPPLETQPVVRSAANTFYVRSDGTLDSSREASRLLPLTHGSFALDGATEDRAARKGRGSILTRSLCG